MPFTTTPATDQLPVVPDPPAAGLAHLHGQCTTARDQRPAHLGMAHQTFRSSLPEADCSHFAFKNVFKNIGMATAT